ncbi:MAG TPA: prolyl oligopeptidase family serine peptidase [Thermoanaerobaculia bacterium]|nr:prolyl oligopeptidase family serine peptidase [Thermoanaerobaculia bacterium]
MIDLCPRRLRAAALLLAAVLPGAHPSAFAQSAAPPELTLERIMADPDWIGNPPEKPYWADDGGAVYFEQKRQGSPLRDLYRLPLGEREPRLVADAERGAADAPAGDVSRDRKGKVYVRDGDVFWKDLGSGAIRQLTRTAEVKTDPRFMAGGGRVSFRVKEAVFLCDLRSGLISQPADLRLAKDPAEQEPADFLRREQLRLFEVLREDRDHKRAERERAQAAQRADPTRPPLPWYLGDKIKIDDLSLSPSGDWMVLVTRPKDAKEGKKAVVPRFVTDTGYVNPEEARALVGTASATGQGLILLDLRYHQRHDLDLSELPGIKDDPLKALRAEARARAKAAAAAEAAAGAGGATTKPPSPAIPEAPAPKATGAAGAAGSAAPPAAGAGDSGTAGGTGSKADGGEQPAADKLAAPAVRPVEVEDVSWTDDGRRAAVELRAVDNKDRWIATVDLDGARLTPRHRETDNAWINWDHNTIGWLADGQTLYFESEESGYNHFYLLDARDGRIRQLTSGKFEVSSPEPSFDGRTLYYVANASHPGNYDVWRVDVATGQSEQLTRLGGLTGFWPSLDERQLLVVHSSLARHNELYVQPNRPGAEARRITDTVSPAFAAQQWTVPEILPIPSTHGAGLIHSRLYTPPEMAGGAGGGGAAAATAAHGKRPAVVFIHGAGYLQDAHYGWSYYFHEFMFHSLLTRRGYVVLDMDYRASAGYGRDWRTAIYRQMGHPELEDLQDGVDWLVQHQNVDRSRVGVYGGSYGGFLTLMALFRKPDLFAAGAALRPVTDWSDYNQDYTGAILNNPEIDPEAYERSSPIEFAAGLAKPLLICHGMVDDNVFFADSVRLVQRLVELGKQDFQIAPYPVESHAFERPSSWLDEYRRIDRLFAARVP